jgi:5-methylcytosine-specific restriction endonuclease McrA
MSNRKEKAQELRRGGMSYQDISTEIGCSKSTVHGWCHLIALSELARAELDKATERKRATHNASRDAASLAISLEKRRESNRRASTKLREADRGQYNRYHLEYNKRRYALLKEEALRRLGGACVSCGSTEELEFDHILRSSKSKEVTRALLSSRKGLEEELDKCQLLCKPCHLKKTLEESGREAAEGTHGTLSSYRYCHCDLCRKAKRDWQAKHRAKNPR